MCRCARPLHPVHSRRPVHRPAARRGCVLHQQHCRSPATAFCSMDRHLPLPVMLRSGRSGVSTSSMRSRCSPLRSCSACTRLSCRAVPARFSNTTQGCEKIVWASGTCGPIPPRAISCRPRLTQHQCAGRTSMLPLSRLVFAGDHIPS